MKNPWKTLAKKVVYDNNWIQVSHRDVITPGGSRGIYGVVSFKNKAIGVVPIDEAGDTWLVRQYRYTLDRYTWEIPEGGCPNHQSPLEAAKRELREETGLSANKWTQIAELHTSNSVTDEHGIVFLATGLTEGEQSLEDTEDIVVKKLPFAEAVNMVRNGEITDAVSMIGILKAQDVLGLG